MKADSIIRIETMLNQKRQIAHASYKNICYNLDQKYGKWDVDTITGDEKNMVLGQKQICNEMDDLYKDFMSHQW